jgi:hypothetical protein
MSEATTAAPPSAPDVPPAPLSAAPAPPPDWRASLPPELREAPSLAKFADPAALAKSYSELETLIGRKGVVVPGDKDGPEAHARFRQALGVPDKPEGYQFQRPEGVPEAAWNAEGAKQFATWAHELGLTPQQAQGLAERFGRMQGEAAQRAAEGIEPDGRKMEDVLRSEWGAKYDAQVEVAKRAAKQFGDAAALDALEAKVGGAAMVRMFARIGEALGEDTPAGMGTGRGGVMTPGEAKAELQRLRGDMKGPYWDRFNPEHKATVERALDLERMVLAAG